MKDMDLRFSDSFVYKLIYVFRINDKLHDGLLKIGDASIETQKPLDELIPNCHELNRAAKKRIDQYTSTAGIPYELLHTEIILSETTNRAIRDYEIHDVLIRSGIAKHHFETNRKQNEWFAVDLKTVTKAIAAVKKGRKSLMSGEISENKSPIVFRREQDAAIKQTLAHFTKGNDMLWNAKMRFGKTLSALEVIRRKGFKRTLILTHRPVVNDQWFEDFHKIFYDTPYLYGSKKRGRGIELCDLQKSGKKYIYFASIQDVRGSSAVGGNFDKNDELFQTEWDLIIVDEAHEGTQTLLGESVLRATRKKHTKVLKLSGTPFNILDEYTESEIFTWDYVMEQKAKNDWYVNRFGDSNPYEELPQLNIYTYDLNKLISGYVDIEDKAFNFREFFRTWTGDMITDRKSIPETCKKGDFVHEKDVWNLLNLLTKKDSESYYPYSTEKFRNFFRHSLWMLPGIKEAKALSALMKKHPVIGSGVFKIVNVAGEGDEEQDAHNALKAVREAIESSDYTITLSCGRLTTGVSVPEWTAVFMLAGMHSTSVASYLQTIFRVQTPANINGRIKEKCYVFDFAPDRTLKMVAEASKISAQAGKTTTSDREIMGEFLNFCPVIAIRGSRMQPYDVDGMLQQLKRAYTDKVVRSGFDNNHIYNDRLLQLHEIEIRDFEALRKIVGASKQTQGLHEIEINRQGLTNEEWETVEQINKKPKKERTEEEKQLLAKLEKERKLKRTAISILRGISIRIPLLIYGADIPFDEEVTIDNFTSLIDDASWQEFMIKGVDKATFRKFSKYYDQDIFVSAGRQIRNTTRSADELSVLERTKKIAKLFSTFKNPDKETVLTPWRVVNMQMGDCLGGYNFFDESYSVRLETPRFIDHGSVTKMTLENSSARILEINSKTGLYPLYATYSIFRYRCKQINPDKMDAETEKRLWNETVTQNLIIVCNTAMARSITKRTLLGYTTADINALVDEKIIESKSAENMSNLIAKIKNGNTYKKNSNIRNMKFDAIIGNPPFQVMDGGSKSSAIPIYNRFVELAKEIKPKYISMIMPAKWYNAGRGLDKFRENMLNDNRIKHLVDFADSTECFSGVDIAGGVCYFLWDESYSGMCTFKKCVKGRVCEEKRLLSQHKTLIRDLKALDIIEKVRARSDCYLSSRVSSQKPFGLRTYVKPHSHGDLVLRYSGGKGPFPRSDVKINLDIIDKWKVVTSYLTHDHAGRAANDGRKRVISILEILSPKEVCTETYLVIDSFRKKSEAKNLLSYIKTKFVRFLIAQVTATQHLSKNNFVFVPTQDFAEEWTDDKLYKKYDLSTEEVDWIEASIKSMG